LSRLATSFVLGYHGCERTFARRAVLEGAELLQSENDYDWLGPGAYFWESDPARAMEWAAWKVKRGDYAEAGVVGAVIDLGNCLDLSSREDIELVRAAHASYKDQQELSGLPLPVNKGPRGTRKADRVLRYLDCAVIRHLHDLLDGLSEEDSDLKPFDTVRGLFVEGGRAFRGSGFHKRSHVQIAVRNADCIKGLFLPPDYL
jgi:hypothetical protein